MFLQALFQRTFSVAPEHSGFLFQDNHLWRKLEPGVYKVPVRAWDKSYDYQLVTIPLLPQWATITNQEVLTSDQIALRFSFSVLYRIEKPERVLPMIDLNLSRQYLQTPWTTIVHQFAQVAIRELMAQYPAESVNDLRAEILAQAPNILNDRLAVFGLAVDHLLLRDINFPRHIQQLFAKRLESKLNAEAELAGARATVAAARALKNASKLMEGDENIRFLRYLETMQKVAANGKHTFVFGDYPSGIKQ